MASAGTRELINRINVAVLLIATECLGADVVNSLPKWQIAAWANVLDNLSKPVQLPCKDVERARLLRAKVPQPVHVMAIHTETVPEKMWPTDRFISLLDKFFENHPNYVAFVVDKADRALDAGEHSNHVIPLPFQPLATAFALVGESDLFLGVDSCMLHAADLFRVPGVGLFGPTDYRVFGFRFGSHQHVYSNGCMEDINEEDVLTVAPPSDLFSPRELRGYNKLKRPLQQPTMRCLHRLQHR